MKLKILLLIMVILLIYNNLYSQIANAGADQSICNNATLLEGNELTTGTGIWLIISGNGTFLNQNNPTTIVTNLSAGANVLQWSITDGGNTTYDEVSITNNKVAFAGNDTTTVLNSITLNANLPLGATGFWTIIEGTATVSQPNNPNSLVSNLAFGKNILQWTVNYNNCVSFDEIKIYKGAYAGADQSVCTDTAKLEANYVPNSISYWSVAGGHGVFDNINDPQTVVRGIYEGINSFYWTVTKDGVTTQDEVVITNNKFHVDAGWDQIVSVPNANLNADQGGYIGYGNWSVIGGQGIIANTAASSTNVTNLQYGYNTFRWNVFNPTTGCSDSDDVNIIFHGLGCNNGGDQHICTDTAVMQATPVLDAETYWSIVLGYASFDDPNDATTIARNISRGENVFRWNITKNGYTSYCDVSIFNYQFDIYAGNDQILCENSSNLQASGMFNEEISGTWEGQWSVLSGEATISNLNSPTSYVTNLDNSSLSNELIWTVTRTGITMTNGGVCVEKDTINLRYYDMPSIDFAMTPTNGKGCSPLNVAFRNTTSVLDTIPGTEYSWIELGGEFNVNGTYESIFEHTFVNESNINDTTFYVELLAEVEIAENVFCRDSVIKPVTVYFVPKVEFYPNTYSQMYPSTTFAFSNLSSPNCNLYLWDFGNGDYLPQNTLVEYFSYDGYTTWGDYKVSLLVDNGRCQDSASIILQLLCPRPVRLMDDYIKACSVYKHEFMVADVLYTTEDSSEYLWDIYYSSNNIDVVPFMQIEMDSREDIEVVAFENAGTYIAHLYASGEGSDLELIEVGLDSIIVYDIPKAVFEVAPLEVMLPSQPIHCYNYSENGSTFYWDFGDGSFSNEVEPLHYYTEVGEYQIKLTVTSKDECVDIAAYDKNVDVKSAGNIVFPNAFTPNTEYEGDGYVVSRFDNDVFLPAYSEGVETYRFEIFNRYGAKVFVSDDINKGWTGYYQKKLCEIGGYKYSVTGKYKNGVPYIIVGEVALVY